MKELIKVFAISVAIALIAFAIYSLFTPTDKFDPDNYHKVSHQVDKGETLWELGSFCKRPDDDVREWIKAVKDLNGMSSSGLVAGDYITIYVHN